MKKSRKIISLALVLALCLNCFVLAACNDPKDVPTDTYKVVFDYNDGGASRSLIKSVEKGKSISEPARPKIEGYTFDGWYTEKEGGEKITFDYTPTQDVTLYAHYTRNKLTVAFDYNYKGAPNAVTQTVDYESNISSAPDTIPVREGYTFDGWYTGKFGGQEAEFPYLVTKNTTFYARWNAEEYNIVFDYNYEDGGQKTRAAKHDTLISSPSVPARVGYEFLGWFTQAAGGERVSFPYAVKSDATLYAQWKARPLSVIFDYNYAGAPEAKEVFTSYGETVTAPAAPARSGYKFLGWFTDDGLAVTFTETITESKIYYAQWSQNDTYKITIYVNESSEPLEILVEKGKALKGTTTPERLGWVFDGYYTAATDGEKIEFPYTPTSDITLYAHWSVAVYDIVFDYNFADGPESKVVSVEHGSEVTEPEIPARTGYSFAGWWTTPVTDGAQVTFPITATRNVTYYARWTPNPHTITFDFNYPGGPKPYTENTYYDATVKSRTYFRKGYVLEGWYTEPEGGEKIDFTTFRVKGDATFYAHWVEVDYTVEFRYNYTDAPARAYVTAGVKQSDPYVTPPAEDPVRYYESPDTTEYRFVGWYTTAVGGVLFDFENTVITGDTNIYAHWEHLPMTPTNNIFHAEYVYYDPTMQYPGYSGYSLGAQSVTADSGRGATVDPDYRVPSTLKERKAYYANYLYRKGIKLEFIIESTEAVSGVALYAKLASEMITPQEPHRLAPTGREGYAFIVNGEELNYSPIGLSFVFEEYFIANINLKKGTNTIVLMTNNDTSMGGTTYAKAPQVDYIRLANVGNAVLTWKPIYDNLEAHIYL